MLIFFLLICSASATSFPELSESQTANIDTLIKRSTWLPTRTRVPTTSGSLSTTTLRTTRRLIKFPTFRPLYPKDDVAGYFVIKSHHDSYLRCPEEYDHKVHAVNGPTKSSDRWSVLHKGDKVVLKRSDLAGHYLSADRHGHVSIVNSTVSSALWTAIRNDDWTWSFKSAHGQWLSALEDGFVRTNAKRGPWENFSLEASKLHRWSAQVSGQFALKSVHDTYLRAHGPEFQSNRVDTVARKKTWEQWTILDVEGKVLLKEKYGRFLGADKFGHASLETIVSDNEIWIPYKNDDGSWSFRSRKHGQWLSALDDGFVRTIGHRKEFERFTLEPWN